MKKNNWHLRSHPPKEVGLYQIRMELGFHSIAKWTGENFELQSHGWSIPFHPDLEKQIEWRYLNKVLK